MSCLALSANSMIGGLTKGNLLSLEVRKINDVNGDRTLNVDDQGGIYIYYPFDGRNTCLGER